VKGAEGSVSRGSSRSHRPSSAQRKFQRLCAQVEQVVSLSLGGSEDERLRSLVVHSVHAAGDGSRLVVSVAAGAEVSLDELDEIYAALLRAGPWLRRQVAAEIHRKRTPDLSFQVLPAWQVEP
jgi:ribosome-binding factor A